jgi:hypothetical protein
MIQAFNGSIVSKYCMAHKQAKYAKVCDKLKLGTRQLIRIIK